MIEGCLFGSLNYDCLFEQAIENCGVVIDYTCDNDEFVRVAKLHGSCNFVIDRPSQHHRAIIAGTGVHLEVGVNVLSVQNLEQVWKSQPDHLPIMSQISPNKEHLLAPAKIQEIRSRWSTALTAAKVVVIIGVSCNQNDTHIVDAIRGTRARVLFIGGPSDFEKWQRVNRRCVHLAETFQAGFRPLLRRLRLSKSGKKAHRWIGHGLVGLGVGFIGGMAIWQKNKNPSGPDSFRPAFVAWALDLARW
jgi:hypothetical protein